ncbi:hypothetical protein ACW4TU_18560 [Streptomyces sp. QTS52]
MDTPPPAPATAERLAALRHQLVQEGIARAYLNARQPAVETAGAALAEFARCLRENPPTPPRQNVLLIRDETHSWSEIGGVVGIDFGFEPRERVVVWPRQHGKSALTLEATFHQTDGLRDLFARVDAHVHARRQTTVTRLADEFHRPRFLVRRQFDAVQDVLEQAGIGDGYGGLTIRQPVRPPVPAPSR